MFLRDLFGKKEKVFCGVDKSLNTSRKQSLIPDLLVVSASIVVLAFGSNGQVTLLRIMLSQLPNFSFFRSLLHRPFGVSDFFK